MPSRPGKPKRKRLGRRTTAAMAVVIVVLVIGAYFGYTTFLSPRVKFEPVSVIIPAGVGKNSNLNFSPAVVKLVIGVNNTVIWVNRDVVNHTVDAILVPQGAVKFSSGGPIMPGQNFTVTLTVPGSYTYQCDLHPQWMQGGIVVKQAS